MATMPPGFKFQPSAAELVNHYLNRKTFGCFPVESNEQQGLVIPDYYIIPDMYIYDYDPWELPKLFRERSLAQLDNGDCYFFCPRRDKYPRGHGENRTTKSGFWKSRGEKQTIRTSKITAEKTGLTFYRGRQRNGTITEYKMQQFRPISNNIGDITPEEMPYDLCYIYRSGGNSSTAIISTTNNTEISLSEIQSDHQRLSGSNNRTGGNLYSSQAPMYYGANEPAFPSTAHAYNSCDHQVDQSMESEEIYGSLQQLDDKFSGIYPLSPYT